MRLWFLFLSVALAAGLAGGVYAADEVVETPADQPVDEDATSESEGEAPTASEPGLTPTPPPTSDISLAESAATITEALQGQDGLRIQTLCTHCNNANVQVGGLSQELVPILLNGYPVLDGLSTSMIFSVLPADTVAGAKVTKGPGAGVAPAPAAGGVISLTESRPTELPRIDVRAEGGSFMRRRGVLRFAGPLTRGVSASIVVGSEAADPVDDDLDGFNDVGALDRQFTAARLDMEFARKHTVDVGVTYIDEESTEGKGAFDRWYRIIDPTSPDTWVREDAVLDRIEFRTGWEYRLGGGRTLDLRVLHGDRNQSLISQANTDSGPFPSELTEWLRVKDVTTWGSARFRQTLGVKGMIGAGFEIRDQQIDALTRDLAQAGPLQGPFVDLVRSYSGYVDYEQRFGTKWNLALGLRYDDIEWGADDPGYPDEFDTRQEFHTRTQTSPRVTLGYNPAPGWTLRLIGGDSFRVPKSIFSEICCGQRLQRSVDRLPESGRTVGFEGIYQPSPNLRVSVYGARTEFEDHLIRVVGRSRIFVQEYALANVSETRADAAEFALRWRAARRVTFDGSIGWLSHHKTDEGPVLVPMTGPPTGNIDVELYIDRIPYQPVRTGSIAATFTLPHRSSLSAQASYTGWMLIQQYDGDANLIDGLLEELRTTPSFWIAGISFLTPLTKSIELAGGIDNVTDELQSDLGDPSADFNWGPLAGRSWRLGIRYTRSARP